MDDWLDISTAPKDGTIIETRRVIDGEILFERDAAWREVTFPEIRVMDIFVPESTEFGWMYPDIDKRVPKPTHWRKKNES